VGKSGSGKSTLMHLLALLDQPDGGEVLVDGSDATELSVKQVNRLRNRDFEFVFQQFFLTTNASVLDNVVLPLKIAGVGPRERKARARSTLPRHRRSCSMNAIGTGVNRVGAIILVVMFIAFLAGTLPARRAGRQNPIEALRYE
jgi:ABC-type lipoprotein export system ATPase subunit